MADTPRTRANLIDTDFVTGQSAGIGSDDVRNLIVSVAPHYAAADPTVNDDINAASPGPYGIGCPWVNTSTGARFICKDNTNGAAVWKNVVGVYFLEAESTASPNGTVSVDSLTANGAATNIDLAIVPKGTGAFLAAIPDSTTTGGNKRGTNAVDHQTKRYSAARVASGASSAVLGGEDNMASGLVSIVGGGYANTASNNYTVVGGGYANTASQASATVGGGYTNTSSGIGSAIVGGENNTASGSDSLVGGGAENTASGNYSAIIGGYRSTANKHGQQSQAAGRFSVNGDSQISRLVARKSTSDATPAEMFLDNSSARCTIVSDTTWAFTITVVARRTDADNESAAYKFEGCIDNNAGTTALVGSVTKTVLAEDTAAWDCDVTADDTNDALIITVTGEAAKTIRWVARIELTEVSG